MLRSTKFHAERADFRMKSRCCLVVAVAESSGCGVSRVAATPAVAPPAGDEPCAGTDWRGASDWQRPVVAAVSVTNSTARAGQRERNRGSVIESGQM